MRLLTLFAFFLYVLFCRSEEEKLKIGTLKRGEKCERGAKEGDKVKVHYTGKLKDGTVFDSSLERNTPFEFVLGRGQVIKGWDQGLLRMCVGDKRRLGIPSHLGYGASGSPPKIPENAYLSFDVELLAINDKAGEL